MVALTAQARNGIVGIPAQTVSTSNRITRRRPWPRQPQQHSQQTPTLPLPTVEARNLRALDARRLVVLPLLARRVLRASMVPCGVGVHGRMFARGSGEHERVGVCVAPDGRGRVITG